MKHNIFTIYDSKAGLYLPPLTLQNIHVAVRTFSDSVNQEGHQFNKHPEDFTLFHLGEYEDTTAKFTEFNTPQTLGLALEFLKPKEQSDKQETIPLTE